jgi:DNA-binding LytR/AlgR family response regulator
VVGKPEVIRAGHSCEAPNCWKAQPEQRASDHIELERLTAVHTYSDRLAIPENGRVQFVATKDIDWIEAEANYVRFRVGNRTSLHDREHPPYQ